MIGGVGLGARGHVRGVVVAGLGAGAPRVTGVAISGAVAGGREVTGFVLAPLYFRVGEDDAPGAFEGLSVSAYNRIRGRQSGVSIGLLDVADELDGLQIGIINIARNKDSFSVLPLVNYARSDWTSALVLAPCE